MKYERICPICGRSFVTKSARGKYCSALCRKRAFQEKTRSEAQEEAEAQKKAAADKWQKEREAQAEKRRKELEAAASSGDPMAIMQTTTKKDPRYWDAWAAYEIGYSSEMGRTSSASVNGISVFCDHFGDEVVKSIEETGVITTGH